MYLAFIAAGLALAGAIMNYTSTGGTLKDLTDVDKIRSSFKGRDAGMPPPAPARDGRRRRLPAADAGRQHAAATPATERLTRAASPLRGT
jgi:hypothetical protein